MDLRKIHGRLSPILSMVALLALRAHAIILDPNKYYRLESRADGWIANRSPAGGIILDVCEHDPFMRFRFEPRIAPDGEVHHALSTESDGISSVLEPSLNSTSSGAPVRFASDFGSDYQRWQVVDLGDGYVKIVNGGSGLALGHTSA